tara:strand:- start:115 stop:798 length:684 start_codon:yes stop_codon:yes gene_type:complete
MNNFIKLNNINKSFSNRKNLKVLKKLSYNFKLGKIYSLMGPSGSGKSTLLNLLSLIDRPSSGSITYQNKQINFDNSKENDILRANKIGIIYQQDNLLTDFTALENVYLANLTIEKNKEISIAKSRQLLRKVGLSNRVDHFPSELSGGEKQRVSIARALINDPQVILADEPTGSLDQVTAVSVFDIIKKQINSNRIIIFATHNRFFAKKADCILEMVNGNIKTFNARV